MRILWYIASPDGPVPWEKQGSWPSSFEQFRAQAQAIDQLGYYGALLATHDHVSIAIAAALAPQTSRMHFLTAMHPGTVSPKKLAQIALTIDKLSEGRLLFNVVNGSGEGLESFGVHIPDGEGYCYTCEYWDAFRREYAGTGSGYDGRYINLAERRALLLAHNQLTPTKTPYFPLWGAGSSPGGMDLSAKLLDWYLSFADTPPRLGEKFRAVGAKATALGRSLRFGTRLQVIIRDTEEEAWAHAQWLLDQTSVETAIRLASNQLGPEGLNTPIKSNDPLVHKRIEALRAGRLPAVRDLEVYPNVWVGPSQRGFDVLTPWAGTWLVGSTANVADRIREYHAQGTDAFILSGWPLIPEAQRVARDLFPLLSLDHGFEVPPFPVSDSA